MGFSKIYLKDLPQLEQEFVERGLEKFVNRYGKYDALVGSSESMRFLEEKRSLLHNQKLDSNGVH